jgi:hypothetical protein
VTARDAAGNIETTAAWTLRVATTLVVSQTSPADSFATNETRPGFAWTSTGETHRIEIGRDAAFAAIADSTVTALLTWQPAIGLTHDTYWWRVVSWDRAGNRETSATRILWIDTAVAATLQSPDSGRVTNDTTPTFTWTGDGDTYLLQVSTGAGFAVILDNAETTGLSYTPSSGYGQDTYWWRVVARDRAGNVETAVARIIVIDTQLTVALIAPTDGRRTNETAPVFSWTGDGETYVLVVSDSSSFTALVESATLNATSFQTALTYAADTYWWRVAARDRAGNIETTATWFFVIDTDILLILPARDRITNETTIIFTWSGTGDTYQIQIARDTAFASIYDASAPSSATSFTSSFPYAADTYYWRVIARDAASNTETSDFRILVIDTKITVALASPADGSETSETRPLLSWTGDGDTYTVQVARDTGFAPVFDSAVVLAAKSYAPSAAYPEDTYWWRIVARDIAGNVDTTPAWRFTIDTSVIVTLITPIHGFVTNDTTPTFTWTGDADTYRFEISYINDDFSTLYDSVTRTETTFTAETTSLRAGPYYWRVVGMDRLGNVVATASRFLFIDTEVRATLSSPANGTVTDSNRPTFRVTGDADTYIFQISTSPVFATLVDSATGSRDTYRPAFSYSADTYYWRVRAEDVAGNIVTTDSWRLTITGNCSAALVAPANGLVTNDTTPTFIWTGVAETYTFEVSTSAAFASLSDSFVTGGLTRTPAGYGADTWYWRVRATDSTGAVFVTSARTLRIDTGVVVALASPANGALTAETRPTFAWTGDADTYTIELSTSSVFASIAVSAETTALSHRVDAALASETWYWRVIGRDIAGNVETSAMWSLVVDTDLFIALTTPLDGALTNETRPVFTWNGNGETYIFQIARDSAFALIADSATQTGATFTPGAAGYPSDTWYWRVGGIRNGNAETTPHRILRIDTTFAGVDSTPSYAIININGKESVTVKGTSITLASGYCDTYLQVLYQFSPANANIWTTCTPVAGSANPDTAAPFWSMQWNITNLPYGTYDVRAVATRDDGNVDSTPSKITLTNDTVNVVVEEWIDTATGAVIQRRLLLMSETSTVMLFDGTMVVVPAGAVAGVDSVWIRTTAFAGAPSQAPAPADGMLVQTGGGGSYHRIEFENGATQFGRSITLTLPYSDQGLTASETDLAAYYYDLPTASWMKLEQSVVNAAQNYVEVAVTHFTDFAVFAGVAAANLSNIYLYPNPFVPYDGDPNTGQPFVRGLDGTGIIFKNLTTHVDIDVYSVAGRKVATIRARNTGGKLQWDARNDDGREVASGTYFAIVRTPGGERAVVKFVVIR